MRSGCLLAVLVAFGGCADPLDEVRGLHEECVVCTGGGGPYLGQGCRSFHEFECEAGLYCNYSFRSCYPWAEVGESCAFEYRCASGLVCGHDATCEVPLAPGAPCDERSFCVEGTACNSGGAHDDPRAGTCEPLDAPAGAPCSWTAGPAGWTGRGCAPGLTCAPLGPFDEATAAFASPDAAAPCYAVIEQPGSDTAAGALGACLGWPGTCAEPGLGERGAPCTAHAGCASGKCVLLPPPLMAPGADPRALAAPWPGVCAGAEDAMDDTLCTPGAGCDLACARHDDCLPGTLCERWGVCSPQRLRDLGGRCGDALVTEPAPDDRWCGFGLACDVDALTCRVARGAEAGGPCETTEDCAGGLVCAGTCTPHGQQGDTCDADRRCDFHLRCGRATERCEEPGPLYQGADCASDAECSAKGCSRATGASSTSASPLP